MEDRIVDHARRAGEEFVAASRADTAEERAAHRATAEHHVEMLRAQEQARIQSLIEARHVAVQRTDA